MNTIEHPRSKLTAFAMAVGTALFWGLSVGVIVSLCSLYELAGPLMMLELPSTGTDLLS